MSRPGQQSPPGQTLLFEGYSDLSGTAQIAIRRICQRLDLTNINEFFALLERELALSLSTPRLSGRLPTRLAFLVHAREGLTAEALVSALAAALRTRHAARGALRPMMLTEEDVDAVISQPVRSRLAHVYYPDLWPANLISWYYHRTCMA